MHFITDYWEKIFFLLKHVSTLHKIPKFHPIFWCGKFVETLSFPRAPSVSSEICAFPQDFYGRKQGEILALYAVRGKMLTYLKHQEKK